jgi:hypothetical protein
MPEITPELDVVVETTVSDLVEAAVPQQVDFTPYQAAGVLSRFLNRKVREQMLYNYVGKGYIPSTVGERTTNKGARQVKVILRADLVAWITKFAGKSTSEEV